MIPEPSARISSVQIQSILQTGNILELPTKKGLHDMTMEEFSFATYPGGGREQLKQRPGINTRHADAPEFMRITGVKNCAYCGLDLTARFEDWLTMVLDHVVPQSVCKNMEIKGSWVRDYSNAVLACCACNGFCNRYKPKEACAAPTSLSEFYDLRDKIFFERRNLILARRDKERTYFETKPWEPTKRPKEDTVSLKLSEIDLLEILRNAPDRPADPGDELESAI